MNLSASAAEEQSLDALKVLFQHDCLLVQAIHGSSQGEENLDSVMAITSAAVGWTSSFTCCTQSTLILSAHYLTALWHTSTFANGTQKQSLQLS